MSERYRVTLAKRQPLRSRESCDNCLGTALEQYKSSHGVTEAPLDAVQVTRDGTEALYNVFMPGLGTHQFTLHPECANYISRGGVNPAEARLADESTPREWCENCLTMTATRVGPSGEKYCAQCVPASSQR